MDEAPLCLMPYESSALRKAESIIETRCFSKESKDSGETRKVH